MNYITWTTGLQFPANMGSEKGVAGQRKLTGYVTPGIGAQLPRNKGTLPLSGRSTPALAVE